MRIISSIACVYSALYLSPLLAWNFDEHVELGELAYQSACYQALHDTPEGDTRDQLTEFFCDTNLLTSQSSWYGRLAAISGDHLQSPKVYNDTDAQQDAGDILNYAKLALNNDDHFWPKVRTVWERYHAKAIEYAVRANLLLKSGSYTNKNGEYFKGDRYLKIHKLLKSALQYNAFADHFLQDAFSAGHSGFNRANSAPDASLFFHNYWNKNGRIFLGLDDTGKLRSYFACGDGYLNGVDLYDFKIHTVVNYCGLASSNIGDKQIKNNDESNKSRIIQTNVYSIEDIIYTALFGSDNDRHLSRKTEQMFYVYTKNPHINLRGDQAKNGTDTCKDYNNDPLEVTNYKCWMPLNDALPDSVYTYLTVSVGYSRMAGRDEENLLQVDFNYIPNISGFRQLGISYGRSENLNALKNEEVNYINQHYSLFYLLSSDYNEASQKYVHLIYQKTRNRLDNQTNRYNEVGLKWRETLATPQPLLRFYYQLAAYCEMNHCDGDTANYELGFGIERAFFLSGGGYSKYENKF